MVRAIAQKNAGSVSRSYDPSLVIGVIEGFRLAAVVGSAPLAAKNEASPPQAATAEETATDEMLQKAGREWPVEQVARNLARNKIARKNDPLDLRQPEIEAQPSVTFLDTIRSKIELLGLARPKFTTLKAAWRRPAWFKLELPKLGLSGHNWIRYRWLEPRLNKFSPSRLATAAAVLFLCIGSIVAWHRIGAVAGSEAHVRPSQIEPGARIESQAPNVTELRKASVVENSPAIVSSRAKTAEAHESPPVPVGSLQSAAVTVVKAAAKTDTIVSPEEHQPRVQEKSSAPEPESDETDIQATRPPLHSRYPDYSGIESRGVVVLIADVDAEGVVRSVRVVRGNRALAAAAVRAVQQWRYAPYFQDGKPVATETNIVISVFSDDAISMSFPPSVPAGR